MSDKVRRSAGRLFIFMLLVATALFEGCTTQPVLPSWNDGPAKQSIIAFVQRTTSAGSKEFVPPASRLAVFDNDGTLWAEQPLYFQFLFAIDRVKVLAPQHPEWKDKEPF